MIMTELLLSHRLTFIVVELITLLNMQAQLTSENCTFSSKPRFASLIYECQP